MTGRVETWAAGAYAASSLRRWPGRECRRAARIGLPFFAAWGLAEAVRHTQSGEAALSVVVAVVVGPKETPREAPKQAPQGVGARISLCDAIDAPR